MPLLSRSGAMRVRSYQAPLAYRKKSSPGLVEESRPVRSNPHGPYSPATGGMDCSARPIACEAARKIMTPATALDILPMSTFFHCACVGARIGTRADDAEIV